MARNVLVSRAVLFDSSGSGMPAGGATVTVFVMSPNASERTGAVTVNVAVPPLSRFTRASMVPLPEAGPLDPALYVAVHVGLENSAGITSTTRAPVTAVGPSLVTTIV